MSTDVTISGVIQTNPLNSTCDLTDDETCSFNYDCGTGKWYYHNQIGGECGEMVTADSCIYYCSDADINKCPQIGTTGASTVAFTSDIVNNFYTPNGAPLSCTYPESAFATATLTQMSPLTQYRQATNPADYNRAFNQYCFQPISENCPVDETSDQVMPSCSRAASTGQDGLLCKQWLASLDNITRDNYIEAYCTNNKTLDCTCAVPEPASLFRILNAGIGLSGAPQCWWIPCKIQTGAYLIPSAYENQDVCPKEITICENIINFANAVIQSGGTININEVDNYTGCGNTSVGILAFLENNWWIILIVLIIIILIVVLFYWRRSRHSKLV